MCLRLVIEDHPLVTLVDRHLVKRKIPCLFRGRDNFDEGVHVSTFRERGLFLLTQFYPAAPSKGERFNRHSALPHTWAIAIERVGVGAGRALSKPCQHLPVSARRSARLQYGQRLGGQAVGKLSKQSVDDQLILAIVGGASLTDAAAQVGVSERTAHRRAASDDFCVRLEDLRRRMMEQAATRLTGTMTRAAERLAELVESQDSRTALTAAKSVLALENAMSMVERLQRLQLRTLKELREQRRVSKVVVRRAGCVNVANQQVNLNGEMTLR
jgi:hypothetical protein